MSLALRLAAAAVPILFFWRTLGIWFLADDFAWLGLRLSIFNVQDFLRALCSPMAQGTVRFLSERAFFLGFETLFGLNAIPFRIAALAVAAAASVLLAEAAWRLTGSRRIAILTPVLWTSHFGLAAAMGWLSSTNQVWVSALLLAAFAAFTSGRLWVTVACVLLGFGALETMVVFPVLALAWAWWFDRQRLQAALWLTVPSIGFAALHLFVIPKPATDPAYLAHLDPKSLAATLGYYLRLAFQWPGLLLAPIAAWVARGRALWFGGIWFLALIAPVLPFRDHRLEYYLGAPSMAAAFLIALTAERLAERGLAARLASAALLGAVLFTQLPEGRRILDWQRQRSRAVRSLVSGVLAARELAPRKAILLQGISNQLFWDGIFDNPFRIAGVSRVYLAPGAERVIDAHPEWGGINAWLIPPSSARRMLEEDAAVVYEPRGAQLANVTVDWRRVAEGLGTELSPFVDVADPAFQAQVAGGFYPIEGKGRWMGPKGSVRLSAANALAGEVVVTGYHPPAAAALIRLRARVGGRLTAERQLAEPGQPFELILPVEGGIAKAAEVTVELEASPTVRPAGDGRELSLILGSIQLR